MGQGDLERLAETGQRDRERVERRRERWSLRALRRRRDRSERLLDESLGNTTALVVAVLAVAIGVAVALALAVGGPSAYVLPLAIAILVVGAALVLTLVIMLPRRSRHRTDRWFASLPFSIDKARYLADLSTERGSACVHLIVTFRAPVPSSAQDLVANAIVGANRDGGEARFDGDTRVLVRSPRLDTYFTGNADHDGGYNNGRAHRWFRRCVDRGLRVIQTRYPIEHIDVTVS